MDGDIQSLAGQNKRRVLKKTFMTKEIYIGRPSGHVNQCLANLIIDEQLLIWDENNLCTYKKIYPTSKVWILLEFEFDSLVPQQLTPSIKPKINPIDNRKQQSFTPAPVNVTLIPSNVTLGSANAFGSTFPIHQPTIQAPLSVPLVTSPGAEHSHGKPKMHLEQNKNADSQLFASRQKEIQGLPEKDVFKIVTPKKIPSSS